MKVYRFMSKIEFIKLMNGEKLYNSAIHRANTNSVGFCFLKYDEMKPDYSIKFLRGAIFPEICVVFNTEQNLKKGIGIYAKPLTKEKELKYQIMSLRELYSRILDEDFVSTIEVNEYSITEYDSKSFKILKYCDCSNFWNPDRWEWIWKK